MKELRLHHHAELTPPAEGTVPVTAAVGPGGELLVMWTSRGDADVLRGRTAGPVSMRIAAYAPHLTATVPVDGWSLAFPHLQPMPDGGVLLVAARCRRRDGVAERNAAIYDADGRSLRRGVLGDGIADVQTTSEGDVWVGYFDEGVYGNYGWGEADGPEPVGSAGLVRFTAELDVAWRYPYDGGLGAISDCYALNVTGPDAWAYYYTDFPVVRVRDGVTTGWPTQVGGARALVVADRRIALVGGYGNDRDRVVILDRPGFTARHPARLAMPGGRRVPRTATILGRGDGLHVVVGTNWFKWSAT